MSSRLVLKEAATALSIVLFPGAPVPQRPVRSTSIEFVAGSMDRNHLDVSVAVLAMPVQMVVGGVPSPAALAVDVTWARVWEIPAVPWAANQA